MKRHRRPRFAEGTLRATPAEVAMLARELLEAAPGEPAPAAALPELAATLLLEDWRSAGATPAEARAILQAALARCGGEP